MGCNCIKNKSDIKYPVSERGQSFLYKPKNRIIFYFLFLIFYPLVILILPFIVYFILFFKKKESQEVKKFKKNENTNKFFRKSNIHTNKTTT